MNDSLASYWNTPGIIGALGLPLLAGGMIELGNSQRVGLYHGARGTL